MTPKVIYLQVCHGCEFSADELKELNDQGIDICPECWKTHPFDTREVTWCKDKIEPTDKAYFSKEAVEDAVIDMLNYGNIDIYDEAIKYLFNRLYQL